MIGPASAARRESRSTNCQTAIAGASSTDLTSHLALLGDTVQVGFQQEMQDERNQDHNNLAKLLLQGRAAPTCTSHLALC